jgi:hypothetical protein
MKIVIKIVAILAAIIGLMAIVIGSRVLLGFSDPGYPHFPTLIIYNIFMGVVSVIAGIFIWRRNKKSLLYSAIITGLHVIVLLSLVTIFRDIISDQSIGAMSFRSTAWILFSLLIWRGIPK